MKYISNKPYTIKTITIKDENVHLTDGELFVKFNDGRVMLVSGEEFKVVTEDEMKVSDATLTIGNGIFDYFATTNKFAITGLEAISPEVNTINFSSTYSTTSTTVGATHRQSKVETDITFLAGWSATDDFESDGTAYTEEIVTYLFPEKLAWVTDTAGDKVINPVVGIRYAEAVPAGGGISTNEWYQKVSTPIYQYKGAVEGAVIIGYSHNTKFHPATSTTASLNTAAITRVTKVEASLEQLKNSEFKPGSPFKYADTIRDKIPEFTWNIERANHLFMYWNQLGFYGFPIDSNFNYPTNYVMLSSVNNYTYVPTTKLIDVFTNNNDAVTKVVPWKDNLVIFTDSSTSLAEGRIPDRKELIHSDVGLSEKYRDTVKVISDSVVFKSAETVHAFVPTPGTDGATSLRIRDIGVQIAPKLIEFERSYQNAHITSMGYNSKEYWLIYTVDADEEHNFPGLTKIFRYDWTRYAWFINTYNRPLYNFTKLEEQTIVASDSLGNIYDILSNDPEVYYRHLTDNMKAFGDNVRDLTNTDHEYLQFFEKHRKDIEKYERGDLSDLSGTWQDAYINPISNQAHEFENGDTVNFTSYPVLEPIQYEFQLGGRKPASDSQVGLDSVSLLIGNDTTIPVLEQHLDIYTNGHLMSENTISVGTSTSAMHASSPQNKWSFGTSNYQKPVPEMHLRKIRRAATSIDVSVYGSTPNKLYIDSIVFRYRPTTRKRR